MDFDFDFDRPPQGWTLVWLGAGAFVLLSLCCCISLPLAIFLAGPDQVRVRK